MFIIIMVRGFVNRSDELEFLNEAWGRDGGEVIVIYGRRRTGKTELIKQFSEDKELVYFLADERSIDSNIDRFAKTVSDSLEVTKPGVESFEQIFKYIQENTSSEIIVAIDEFSYLVDTDEAIPSVFQRIIDEQLEEDIFLILCGSSVSMMLEGVLSYDSPLYGRRTGQWKVKPMDFQNSIKFVPKYNTEEQITTYSVTGGIPAYLQKIDDEKILIDNIDEKILSKGKFLHEETKLLLTQELRKPARYFDILEKIAAGNTKPSEIAKGINVETSNLSPYLNKLQELEIIQKETPITTEKKRGVYRIKDDFFRFHFSYVYPNKSDLESGETQEIKEEIQEKLPQHTSETFEKVCRETIKKETNYSKTGRWWYKEEEIDIVALKEGEEKILFGECKWTKEQVGMKLLKDLEGKSGKVRWRNQESRNEEYVLFSKNGFTEELSEEAEGRDDLRLYGLERVSSVFQD